MVDTTKLIEWRFARETGANNHICDQVRSALWHLFLSVSLGKKEIGFDAVDAHPIALQDAAAKSFKFVPYSPSISTTPPAKGTSYIPINVCVKGSGFQKLYIANPRDVPTTDSLTEGCLQRSRCRAILEYGA